MSALRAGLDPRLRGGRGPGGPLPVWEQPRSHSRPWAGDPDCLFRGDQLRVPL